MQHGVALGFEGTPMDPDDLRSALAAFDPVWEHRTTAERALVVQLLVERIEYDGRDGNLDITFPEAGGANASDRGRPCAGGRCVKANNTPRDEVGSSVRARFSVQFSRGLWRNI